MNVHGRHLMINCEGEGQTPPVSIETFCEYLANSVEHAANFNTITPKYIKDAVERYERGER